MAVVITASAGTHSFSVNWNQAKTPFISARISCVQSKGPSCDGPRENHVVFVFCALLKRCAGDAHRSLHELRHQKDGGEHIGYESD